MPDWILFFFFLIRDPVSFDSWLQGWKGGNEGIVRVWLAFTPQAFPTEPSRAEPTGVLIQSANKAWALQPQHSEPLSGHTFSTDYMSVVPKKASLYLLLYKTILLFYYRFSQLCGLGSGKRFFSQSG